MLEQQTNYNALEIFVNIQKQVQSRSYWTLNLFQFLWGLSTLLLYLQSFPTGVLGNITQLRFNAQKLIVFGNPV